MSKEPPLIREELILVRLGEIALKGLNRGKFEQQLFRNIRYRLASLGPVDIVQQHSRVYVRPKDPGMDLDAALLALKDVFGLVSSSKVLCFEASPEAIQREVEAYADHLFADGQAQSFKFEIRRINKNYPSRSYDLACELGDQVLARFPQSARVDVQHPDLCFHLEIREKAYLYHALVPGPKGLPVGVSGKGMLLLSGGIDSPVAGYQMASRGLQLEAIYFHTFPYTSDDALEKVRSLGRILSRYAGQLLLHVVDFTAIQLQLNEDCPEDMLTVVMRRVMLRIAQEVAQKQGAKCLITGESLGQVASQTLEALACTDAVASLPIFRPLIGTDKDATIQLARKIGSFDTSILPYDDCCTIFVAKHPRTHPSLRHAEQAEKNLAIEELVKAGVAACHCERLQASPRKE